MKPTGIELLAADLGTTPDRLVLYILAFFVFLTISIVYACVKLSDNVPPEEGLPDDLETRLRLQRVMQASTPPEWPRPAGPKGFKKPGAA